MEQNRRQKVFNGGLCVCAPPPGGGLDILKIDKNASDS